MVAGRPSPAPLGPVYPAGSALGGGWGLLWPYGSRVFRWCLDAVLGAPADVLRALLVLSRRFFWGGPSGGEKKKKPDHGHHVVNLAQSGLPTEGHTISMQLNS